MGLFSSYKKKKPEELNSTSQEHFDVPNFDQLLAEAPLPPSELSKTELMPDYQRASQQNYAQDIPVPEPDAIPSAPSSYQEFPLENEEIPEPIHDLGEQEIMPRPVGTSIPKQTSSLPKLVAESESFELPDFDESEIKELEGLSNKDIKTPFEFDMFKASNVSDTSESAPSKEMPKIDLDYPKENRPKIIPQMKYVEVEAFIKVMDLLNETKVTARKTEDLLERHTNTMTSKNEKYKQLVINLNLMQDKIIHIDNKLFGN